MFPSRVPKVGQPKNFTRFPRLRKCAPRVAKKKLRRTMKPSSRLPNQKSRKKLSLSERGSLGQLGSNIYRDPGSITAVFLAACLQKRSPTVTVPMLCRGSKMTSAFDMYAAKYPKVLFKLVTIVCAFDICNRSRRIRLSWVKFQIGKLHDLGK